MRSYDCDADPVLGRSGARAVRPVLVVGLVLVFAVFAIACHDSGSTDDRIVLRSEPPERTGPEAPPDQGRLKPARLPDKKHTVISAAAKETTTTVSADEPDVEAAEPEVPAAEPASEMAEPEVVEPPEPAVNEPTEHAAFDAAVLGRAADSVFYIRPDSAEEVAGFSGVAWSAAGEVVTCARLIDGARGFAVWVEGKYRTARLVGVDSQAGLALIRVRGELPVSPARQPALGRMPVFGVSRPTAGPAVFALGTVRTGDPGLIPMTVDVAQDRNAGGALVVFDGAVVGIICPSDSGAGDPFVPVRSVDEIAAAVDRIRADSGISAADLGLSAQGITPDLAAALGLDDVCGALLNRVAPDSPAFRSGMRHGDVIRSVNGIGVCTGEDLAAALREGNAPTIGVDFTRGGTSMRAEVRVPRSDAPVEAIGVGDGAIAVFGMTLRFGEDGRLRVQSVTEGGPASRKDVRPGDVVSTISREPVAGTEQIKALIAQANGVPVLFYIQRGAEGLYKTLAEPKPEPPVSDPPLVP